MENVILIILLILALALIGIVLMQRSEGGGLGIGGGGGVVSGRSAATALGKLTWILGAAFMVMCLLMTILATRDTAGTSVIDRLGAQGTEEAPAAVPAADELLPPSGDDEGLLPPRAD